MTADTGSTALGAINSPVPKGFVEGTHRTVRPESTISRVLAHAGALGITRLANITGLDRIGIPVVVVCRPNSRSVAVSQGKGLTLEAAKASGLMEATELAHAEQLDLPVRLASRTELCGGGKVLDVARLPVRRGRRFDPRAQMLWVRGVDLLSGEPTSVPYDSVHCDLAQASNPNRSCFPVTSNGLASGNHLVEATSHALCELVERDAMRRWQRLSPNSRAGTRLDLSSVEDGACRSVLGLFAAAGIAVAAWEMTSPVAIPAFRCAIADSEEAGGVGSLYTALGYGCHPHRPVALLRALTEAAQSRAGMVAGSRDDVFASEYARYLDPEVQARQRSQLTRQAGGRPFADGPGWYAASLEEDLGRELECLAAAGVRQAVMVDLTRREIGIPVVRVVVPGIHAIHGNLSQGADLLA